MNVTLRLKPETLARARALAAARQCTVEELLTGIVEEAVASRPLPDPITGAFADEPQLMADVAERAMADRERRGAPATLPH